MKLLNTKLKPTRISEAWKKKGDYVFFNSYRGVILNKNQSLIWESMDGSHTIEEIYDMFSQFNRRDIEDFISRCLSMPVIELLEDEDWDI